METCCRDRYACYDISIYLYLYIVFFFVNITDRICLEIICGVAREQKEEVEKIPTLLASATGDDTFCIYYTERKRKKQFWQRSDFRTDGTSEQISSRSFSPK